MVKEDYICEKDTPLFIFIFMTAMFIVMFGCILHVECLYYGNDNNHSWCIHEEYDDNILWYRYDTVKLDYINISNSTVVDDTVK